MSKDKNKEIVIEVTQEEYDQQLATGLTEDEVLKPGRHIFRRGGFLERHPNFNLENVEIKITNSKKVSSLLKTDNEKKAA